MSVDISEQFSRVPQDYDLAINLPIAATSEIAVVRITLDGVDLVGLRLGSATSSGSNSMCSISKIPNGNLALIVTR